MKYNGVSKLRDGVKTIKLRVRVYFETKREIVSFKAIRTQAKARKPELSRLSTRSDTTA